MVAPDGPAHIGRMEPIAPSDPLLARVDPLLDV